MTFSTAFVRLRPTSTGQKHGLQPPATRLPSVQNNVRLLLLRYGVALGSAALAVLLREALTPLWGPQLPFLTLFPAVFLSAWYGGLGPGLVTTTLCALAAIHLWLVPFYPLSASSFANQVGLVLAVLMMLLITWLTAALRQAQETLEYRVQERTAELTQANDALYSERTRLTTMLEHLPVGVIFSDATSGKTLLANAQAKQIWRYESLPDLYSSEFARYQGFFPDGRPYQSEDWPVQRVLKTGETITGVEIAFIRGDDTRGIMQASAAPIRDPNGHVTTVVMTIADITARKQMEKELRTLNVELEQRVQERTADLERASADLRQIAYIAAHDLQEPVRQIGIYSQKITERYRDSFDSSTTEAVGFIVAGTQRMIAQFNDLMHYLEVDDANPERTTTDCEVVLQNALMQIRESIVTSNATITHDPLPIIKAHPTHLQLVFQELLDNAVKFRTTAPPQVHVWAEREERGWRFAVRDHGISIDPQYYGRLFGLFKRIERDRYPGTGMGLAICKKIVERHGGGIWLEPTSGGGVTVIFTINDVGEERRKSSAFSSQ